MKATSQELSHLMELAEIERELMQNGQQLAQKAASTETLTLNSQLSESFESSTTLRSERDRQRDALRKLQIDVELVQKRLHVDEARLNALTNAKDVAGTQHEMESLKQRISVLEDQELELMENLEQLESELEVQLTKQAELRERLAKLEHSTAYELAELNATKTVLLDRRSQMLGNLGEELHSVYLRKSARGLAVAKLDGRECGACRLALTAAAYDDISASPHDEIPSCPNCQALILR